MLKWKFNKSQLDVDVFSVHLVHIFRIHFPKNTFGRLLLLQAI